jgi:dTDP-4-dehydrorhamnose reductase
MNRLLPQGLKPTCLLFGAHGQIGYELNFALKKSCNMIPLHKNSREYCGDLSNLVGISDTIRVLKPNVIINAAAYTAVDKAEQEVELATELNAIAPEHLAKESEKCGSLLVHYSTDYVFNGEGSLAWKEIDAPEALNVYGKTKLAGERSVALHTRRYLIIRTSWVYSTRGQNFIKTMLRLANEKDRIEVVDDQIGAPTAADLIAKVTGQIVQMMLAGNERFGLYHLAAHGHVSWYEYAKYLIDCALRMTSDTKITVNKIYPVSSDRFLTKAIRPLNSRLNTDKIKASFGVELPDWKDGVYSAVSECVKVGLHSGSKD